MEIVIKIRRIDLAVVASLMPAARAPRVDLQALRSE